MQEEYRGPMKPWEQPIVIDAFSGYPRGETEKEETIERLHEKFVKVFESNNIHIIASGYRGKSRESIKDKLKSSRNPELPLLDGYGLRFVVHKEQVDESVEVLKNISGLPDKFPFQNQDGDIETARDGHNEWSHSDYGGKHVNFMFGDGDIGEIQVYTDRQFKAANRTRNYYEHAREKS